MKYDYIIVGAGLSGLSIAAYLEKIGKRYLLLEARERNGGRIVSSLAPSPMNDNDRFDLGPSWFWPSINPRVTKLVDDLALPIIAQHQNGDMMLEQVDNNVRRISSGFFSAPSSMRLAGGMAQLIKGVSAQINPDNIKYSHQVQGVHQQAQNGYMIDVLNQGKAEQFQTEQVIFAIPHRLIANNIDFSPALPEQAINVLNSTDTWMAAHAKFFAIYDKPFWRENGLSGHASSQKGPLVEIHDASAEEGHGALFGFVGFDANTRSQLGETHLKQMAIEQLIRLFGPEAENVKDVKLLDWSKEAFTATARDQTMPRYHPRYGLHKSLKQLSQQGLLFAGTESAEEFGGFIEGALEAAEAVIKVISE
ncbi:oxidoreductase [Vibrio azureus]|uniref:Putative amine oxidase n=1 Tax=Vibrio azureus NBRC 104587 TaxID=1219077 RepID=U3AMI9_9VIBR|nr:FAD-dependent oxidoreductase [Vibrio azureus]AUI87548.1 oxidoreductase [Vibrio azureus]GAD74517.1 putative amine oxidase [Vibrio azureus NBRC 104587]